MSNIVLIASGDALANLGKQFQQQVAFPDSLSIVNAYMENAVDYARHQLPENTDVIIARGNTAKLLKAAHLSIPVVTIPIKDSELIRSITTASALYGENDSQIAYIGMEDVIRSVKGFLDMLHRKIKLYSVESSQDIYSNILRAKKEHVNVVIGGVYTQQLAEQYGLNCVLLESSIESVKEAYERALEVQKGISLQKKKLQERLIMTNAISDALIGINEKGRINLFNAAAQNLFNRSENETLGKPYSTLFSNEEMAIINRIFLRGDEITGHSTIIKGVDYLLDFHPVMISGKSRGIIVNAKLLKYSDRMHKPSFTESSSRKDNRSLFIHPAGNHPAFIAACSIAKKYAPCTAPILIIGEVGTGKTTFAKWIHDIGARRKDLFLIQDSRLLSIDDLLSANHGTLYIRDIEGIEEHMAAVLVELLEKHTVCLHNHTHQKVDVRIIAGSSCSLPDMIPQKLYYSLNALLLPLPALRQRSSDIILLFKQFCEQSSIAPVMLSEAAADALTSYSWPGNLLQLKSFCLRFACLNPVEDILDYINGNLGDRTYYSHLSKEDYPISTCTAAIPAPPKGFIIHQKFVSYDELRALSQLYQGRKNVLAQKLEVSRSTLWRYFKIMEENL